MKKIIILLMIIYIFLLSPTYAIELDSNQTLITSNHYLDPIESDSLDSLKDIINTSNNNDSIYANDIELTASEINNFTPITIDKSISIIGNNVTVNGNGNPNLFIISPNNNVTIKNIIFTNTTSFIFTNNGNMIIENCTFTDIWESAINNTGKISIINSTFENIKSIYTNENIDLLKDYYHNSGVIYNTGTLIINNTKFNNIESPKQITFDDDIIVKKEGIIYNLNNATIINSNFTNITGRVINNTGKLELEKSNIENIYNNGFYIQINTTTRKVNKNIYIDQWFITDYASYSITFISETCSYLTYTTINGKKALVRNLTYIKSPNGLAIYNSGKLTLKNNNVYNIGVNTEYNTNPSPHKGGAIANYGLLNIENTTITKSYAELGGAIYNDGNATLKNITSTLSSAKTHGHSIYNNGKLSILNSTFEKNNNAFDLKLSNSIIYNSEQGKCNLNESIIKDNKVGYESGWPFMYYGVVENLGDMEIDKCIFDNNVPENKYYFVSGSYNIYNFGNLTLTHNIFLNSEYSPSQYHPDVPTHDAFAYAFNDNGTINMTLNYFDINENPSYNQTNFNVEQFFILNIEPEYSTLKIGEKINVTATLKLNNGKFYSNYDLLPDIYITFNVNGKNITKQLIDGKASVEFNQSETKGLYLVTATLGKCSEIAEIDVGKNFSYMKIEAEDIYYEDDAKFIMNVTGNLTNQPTGNISVILDGKKYTTEINNGKSNLTISNLTTKTYDLIMRYEGDEDYFKYIIHQNYTVHKKPTDIEILIPEIYYGETGTVEIYTNSSKFYSLAEMQIADENNKTIINEIEIRNNTNISLNDYDSGEYIITVIVSGDENYESSNATAIFIVKKYETNLTINTTDINAGENQTLTVTLTPQGEVAGEATLKINNHTQIIFLNNGETNITIENLTGGLYNVEIYFPGDKKYAASNATAKFTVKKLQSEITAKIENNILYINTTPNSSGKVQIFINDDVYEVNLTNSQITFPINFTKSENYIFIYYPGDQNYNYSTINLTYEYEELLNLTGYDETFYNTQNQTYYITLTDEEGYGIANKTVTITVNNKTSNMKTTYDGSIILSLDLDVGNHTITARYRNRTATNTITILEDAFITGNDTQAYTNINFTYQIELKDHLGKAIINGEITFKINGKTYTNKTNVNGESTLTLKLPQGNYNITTQYKSVKNTNNIYVGDIILKGNDLTIYNTETGTYELILTDKNGNGVVNQTITITLNNEKYTRTTDKNGSAKLSIKLDTGKYTITSQFNDQKITNKITVLEDAFLSVNNTKTYENVDFTHIAKLTDHNEKGIANAEITFKINGKTYTNKTNNQGLATLNLNLKEGNYTITSTYKNITKTAKIIIVDDSHLVGNDVKAYSGTDFKYKVKLTDHNNQAITDAEITFKINGKTYTNKTNVNGESTLTFNLETGNYTITTTYKNRTIENSFEIIEDYIITGNDIKTYSENDFNYKVKLTDHNAKAIKNIELIFTVNGRTYTNKTDVNGQAIINLNLKTGNYTIKATYRNTTTTNTLIIIEDYIITGNDIKAYAEDDFIYKVTLTDHNAKAIKNQEITFEVNGQTYKNKTDANGQATINLNLKEGNYTITTTYKNTTNTNELEIVEDHMLIGQNIKAYENTDFTYTITLKRTDGTPITNKEITFIINNRRYADTTNSDGKASKTLNLPEGNYTITAIYKNTRITNNLTIIEDYNIEGNNIRTYSEQDFTYKVNLTNHDKKPVKNAEITFTINSQTYKNKTDNNGQSTINLNLEKGNYTITTAYRNVKTTNKLEIIETYQITGINVKSYENFDFEYIITLKNHNNRTIEDAEITFEINGETYKNKTDDNGEAKITLNLKKGNYTIKSSYKDIKTTNKLEIIEYDLERIISSDIEMFYHDGTRFRIQLLNQTTPLANKTITITINGVPYTRTTNENGSTSIPLSLNSGRYTVTTKYNSLEENNTVTIKPTIIGNDITKMFRNATQYYATFYTSKGEILKNTQINFNINGVFYTRTTNENGTAKMNINLNQGTYIITATNPETGEQHSNTITVLPKIQENKDITKYYRNDTQYIVKIIKSDGTTAQKGEKVTFNINGVFYERYTNETGHAKLNINLEPNEYIITAEYEGCKVSNKITVLPILKAQDLTKKYGQTKAFETQLLNGQGNPQSNEKITFNINGVFYTRTTNNDGIAKLNINLQPGEYIITSTYNQSNIANTVKVEA